MTRVNPGMATCSLCGVRLQVLSATSSYPAKVRAHMDKLDMLFPPSLAATHAGALIAHAMTVHPVTANDQHRVAKLLDTFYSTT